MSKSRIIKLQTSPLCFLESAPLKIILSFLSDTSNYQEYFKSIVYLSNTCRSIREKLSTDDLWQPVLVKFQVEYLDAKYTNQPSRRETCFEILRIALMDRHRLIKDAIAMEKVDRSFVKPINSIQEAYGALLVEDLDYAEDSDENFVKTKEGVLTAATLNKLVAQVTSFDTCDPNLLFTVMITYRSFTTRDVLIKELRDRYFMPPTSNIQGLKEFAEWKAVFLDVIRLRIVQLIKFWTENFFTYDFPDEQSLVDLKKFAELVGTIKVDGKDNPHAAIITKCITRPTRNLLTTSAVTPPILKPSKSSMSLFSIAKKKKDKLLEWPAMEVARQLSLIDFSYFECIQPKECLNSNWSRGNQQVTAPNIFALTKFFNNLSLYVANKITVEPDIKDRVAFLEYFIDVAENLHDINNFNSMFAVISGLVNAAVFRMKRTWIGITSQHQKTFNKLNAFMSSTSSFANIRRKMKEIAPPSIPYLGIYLTDLTFVNDGNPNFVSVGEKSMINVMKASLFAGVIKDLQVYQKIRYNFDVCKELQDLIMTTFPNLIGDKDLFQISLKQETRQATLDTLHPQEIEQGGVKSVNRGGSFIDLVIPKKHTPTKSEFESKSDSETDRGSLEKLKKFVFTGWLDDKKPVPRFQFKDMEIKFLVPEKDFITCIQVFDDRIFVGTSDGLLCFIRMTTRQQQNGSKEEDLEIDRACSISEIQIDRQENILFLVDECGLTLLDTETLTPEHFRYIDKKSKVQVVTLINSGRIPFDELPIMNFTLDAQQKAFAFFSYKKKQIYLFNYTVDRSEMSVILREVFPVPSSLSSLTLIGPYLTYSLQKGNDYIAYAIDRNVYFGPLQTKKIWESSTKPLRHAKLLLCQPNDNKENSYIVLMQLHKKVEPAYLDGLDTKTVTPYLDKDKTTTGMLADLYFSEEPIALAFNYPFVCGVIEAKDSFSLEFKNVLNGRLGDQVWRDSSASLRDPETINNLEGSFSDIISCSGGFLVATTKNILKIQFPPTDLLIGQFKTDNIDSQVISNAEKILLTK